MTTSIVNKNIDNLVPVIDLFREEIRVKAFLFGSSLLDVDTVTEEYVEEKAGDILLSRGSDFWYPILPITESWSNYFINIAYGRGILIARKYIARNEKLIKEIGCCRDILSVNPTDIKDSTHFSYHRDSIESCYKDAKKLLTTMSSRLKEEALSSETPRRSVHRAYKGLVGSGLIDDILDVLCQARIKALMRECSFIHGAEKISFALISVMDSRTRKECKSTNGTIYKASALLNVLHKHRLCRCVPIPVSKADTSLLQ